MDCLDVRLHRVLGEQLRTVAAAFDEIDPRDHRIARKRFEIEDQGLLHQAMDHQAVLGRIDIRKAGSRHHEVQSIRGDRAIEQVVRSAGLLSARLAVRISERAHDLVLVLRRHAIGWDFFSGPHAPRIDRQRLGGSAGERTAGAGCSRARKQDRRARAARGG